MPDWQWVVVSIAASLLVLAVAAYFAYRSLTKPSRELLDRINRLPWRAKGSLLIDLLRDPFVPLWLRAVLPALLLYLLLPLDIIPDFIPILGQLDDLLLLLLAGAIFLRFASHDVIGQHVTRLEIAYHPGSTMDA